TLSWPRTWRYTERPEKKRSKPGSEYRHGGDHLRQIQPGQMDYCVAIHLHHVEQSLLVNRMEFAVLAKASIVDQQLDLNSFLLGEGENIFRGIRIRQICREHFGVDFMSSGQLASQFLEAIFPAGCQDEVCCTRCQFFSEGHTNPGTGAGDERPFSGPVCRCPRLGILQSALHKTCILLFSQSGMAFSFLARRKAVSQSPAFPLETVHQAARPDKFRSQQ